MRSRWLTVGVGCVIAAGVFGCGGDNDKSSSPPLTAEQVIATKEIQGLGDRMNRAVDQGNAAAVCAVLAPDGLKKEFGNEKRCQRWLGQAMRQSESIPKVEFNEISVNGHTATAKATTENADSSDYFFVRVDGNWYVDLSAGSAESSRADQ